ncbi:MAG: dinitrogenase iron-molybdenum cofactor [Actinobacteria bacterium HGW-Actinobacteria-5]|jgi:predicted Fe-Mo cluster-binding NifX family protein|nr:MAG: dinitrogenase iron-molybdenum cofactor [Actinobacteria bacterium HGW-Actinobacteria-5]
MCLHPLVHRRTPVIVATPVTEAGLSAAAWGKAHWIGVADVEDGQVRAWQIHEVAWDVSHDEGTHGSHHARIVRFLKEQGIQAVVVDHMGEGMQRVMHTMGIPLLPASPGDAQASVVAALAAAQA